jgi:hypothetical protein
MFKNKNNGMTTLKYLCTFNVLFAGTCERRVGIPVIVWGAVLYGERYSVDIHRYTNVIFFPNSLLFFCSLHILQCYYNYMHAEYIAKEFSLEFPQNEIP